MAQEIEISCCEAQGLRDLQADLRRRGVVFKVEGETFFHFCQRIATEYGARLYQVQIELEHFQDK